MCVLIIDDDRDLVYAQTRLLQHLGINVISCTDPKEAMHLIEEHRPEVVLLDLAMPGLNGFDVAEELQHNPDLKPRCLAAVTGYSGDDMRRRTAAAGFDVHFVKPVPSAQLLEIITANSVSR